MTCGGCFGTELTVRHRGRMAWPPRAYWHWTVNVGDGHHGRIVDGLHDWDMATTGVLTLGVVCQWILTVGQLRAMV